MYRKLSADKIFDGLEWLENGSVLVVDEKGVIVDILKGHPTSDDVEKLTGIIIPGMINAHCHLELSHLKNKIPANTGLVNFLISVIQFRKADIEEILAAADAAEQEMKQNGTVAVVDICNTTEALKIKEKSSLLWYNLIEVINLSDQKLTEQIIRYEQILEGYSGLSDGQRKPGLTPHAPYSVSNATHSAINEATKNAFISIHNQESNFENELFKTGGGAFLKLYEALGVARPAFVPSEKSSLQTYLPHYKNGQTLLLVHNTFISELDIVFAKEWAASNEILIVYCLCPNANLYIESKLPPIDLLLKHDCDLVLGTDSYCSNWQLNIAAEVKTIIDFFPGIPLEPILSWATYGAAKALGFANLGRLEKGNAPGVVLLETKDGLITGKSKRII